MVYLCQEQDLLSVIATVTMVTLHYTNLRRSEGILSRKCDLYFEGCFVEGGKVLQNEIHSCEIHTKQKN